jgi:DNA-directed RNA polymerase specialized sigma subunit
MPQLPDGDAELQRILGSDLEKSAAAESLQKKRKREMQMWQDWKAAQEDPKLLKPLVESFRPVVKKHVNVYKGMVPIPPSAIEAEFKNHLVTAFRTYDPKYGTQLNTHVHNQMKKGRRFVVKYQNIGGIPEQRAYRITEFNTAKAELEQKLGIEPTSMQLADNLGWNQREVERMEAELRQDLPTSTFRSPEGDPYDPTYQLPSREMEVIRLMPHSLDNTERLVFEYTFGLGGKPKMRPGEIATKTGMSPSKVARVRKKLAAKVQEYYGALD